jgi:hypothetical protein
MKYRPRHARLACYNALLPVGQKPCNADRRVARLSINCCDDNGHIPPKGEQLAITGLLDVEYVAMHHHMPIPAIMIHTYQ